MNVFVEKYLLGVAPHHYEGKPNLSLPNLTLPNLI
jgi:hypothetical protein